MSFYFGRRSEAALAGVDARLVRVVRRALATTAQDFCVLEGLRSLETQREYVRRGVSKTMDSRHLSGHAVDLVPIVGGLPRWEWPPIYCVAEAMREAAREAGLPLVWGACWDVDFTTSDGYAADLADDYAARRRAAGKRVFADGPHYEIGKEALWQA